MLHRLHSEWNSTLVSRLCQSIALTTVQFQKSWKITSDAVQNDNCSGQFTVGSLKPIWPWCNKLNCFSLFSHLKIKSESFFFRYMFNNYIDPTLGCDNWRVARLVHRHSFELLLLINHHHHYPGIMLRSNSLGTFLRFYLCGFFLSFSSIRRLLTILLYWHLWIGYWEREMLFCWPIRVQCGKGSSV